VNDQAAIPDRYPPARVAAFLTLPESNARCFAVATALGSYVWPNGSSAAVKSGRDTAGIRVGPRQRGRILEILNIGERRWRQLVDEWESRGVAHRCRSGVVCILVRPWELLCPGCQVELEGARRKPTRPDARRRSGSPGSPQLEAVLPNGDLNTSALGESSFPESVAESAHRELRSLQGLGVGGTWRAIQEAAGEEPLSSDEEALENLIEILGAHVTGPEVAYAS
jgi:hypothetical protein